MKKHLCSRPDCDLCDIADKPCEMEKAMKHDIGNFEHGFIGERTDEKPLDFGSCDPRVGPYTDDDNFQAINKIAYACNGLTLTQALSRLRCPLSPDQVVERLTDMLTVTFQWEGGPIKTGKASEISPYKIEKLLADLTAPKEG